MTYAYERYCSVKPMKSMNPFSLKIQNATESSEEFTFELVKLNRYCYENPKLKRWYQAKRIARTLTDTANWGQSVKTMTDFVNGTISQATKSSPYVWRMINEVFKQISPQNFLMVAPDDLCAVMNPNTYKAIMNSEELAGEEDLSKYLGVEIIVDDTRTNYPSREILEEALSTCKLEDVIFVPAEEIQEVNSPPLIISVNPYSYPDGVIVFLSKQEYPLTSLVIFTCPDEDEHIDKTAEVLVHPEAGYLLLNCLGSSD